MKTRPAILAAFIAAAAIGGIAIFTVLRRSPAPTDIAAGPASSRAITVEGVIASHITDNHGTLSAFVLDSGQRVTLSAGWQGRTPEYYAVGQRVRVEGFLSPDGSSIVRAQVTHL